MAAWDGATAQSTTETVNFQPELWSNEVIASYKANLVAAQLITNFNHRGRKGDAINIPTPGRLTASDKSENVAVTLSTDQATNTQILLNKHKCVAMNIEDIASVQSLDSMRQHYTDDMGYAIATVVDTDVLGLYTGLTNIVIGGDGSTAWDNSGSGNGTALTDDGIREMMQTLDDANVPQDNRNIIIPPVTKKQLLGLPRFTEQAFVGEGGAENSIRNGRIGDIYGMGVYVSTNCPTITNYSGTTSYRVGLLTHRSAFALATQLGMRLQVQKKLEWLSDLLVADTIYGVKTLRTDGAVAFVMPA